MTDALSNNAQFVIRALERGHTYAAIGAQLHLTRARVHQIAKQCGIESRRAKRSPAAEKAVALQILLDDDVPFHRAAALLDRPNQAEIKKAFRALLRAGFSAHQAGRALGLSPGAASRMASKLR